MVIVPAGALACADATGLAPDDVAPLLARNDIVDAYRQCAVSERHSGARVMTTWVTSGGYDIQSLMSMMEQK